MSLKLSVYCLGLAMVALLVLATSNSSATEMSPLLKKAVDLNQMNGWSSLRIGELCDKAEDLKTEFELIDKKMRMLEKAPPSFVIKLQLAQLNRDFLQTYGRFEVLVLRARSLLTLAQKREEKIDEIKEKLK